MNKKKPKRKVEEMIDPIGTDGAEVPCLTQVKILFDNFKLSCGINSTTRFLCACGLRKRKSH